MFDSSFRREFEAKNDGESQKCTIWEASQNIAISMQSKVLMNSEMFFVENGWLKYTKRLCMCAHIV